MPPGLVTGFTRILATANTQGCFVHADVPEHRDAQPTLDQTPHLGSSPGPQHLGPDVIDIERTPDGLARLSRVARHQDRLDLRVEQVLCGGSRARAQPILQAEQTHRA
jgi:hypothetical protein